MTLLKEKSSLWIFVEKFLLIFVNKKSVIFNLFFLCNFLAKSLAVFLAPSFKMKKLVQAAIPIANH